MAETSRQTQRVRVFYDKQASKYDQLVRLSEKLLLDDGRRWVCSQARGEVLEIAVGTGRNLPYYPDDVRLTGVDVSPAMPAIARARTRELAGRAHLLVADAQALPFPDARFDTVVCTLALCTIPNDRRAIAEAKRVLRPGGTMRLLEHVRSPIRLVRIGQRALAPLFLRLEADHLLREPLSLLRAEGFELLDLQRSKLGIVERLAARKPAAT